MLLMQEILNKCALLQTDDFSSEVWRWARHCNKHLQHREKFPILHRLKALYSGFRLVRKDQIGCRLLVGIIFYAGKADLRRQQAIVRGYDGDRAEKVSTQNTTLPKEGRSCSL